MSNFACVRQDEIATQGPRPASFIPQEVTVLFHFLSSASTPFSLLLSALFPEWQPC